MRRGPLVLFIVLASVALIAWRGRGATSPFTFAGARAGADLEDVVQALSSPERLSMACDKVGETVYCSADWAQIGGWFYAITNQDRDVRAVVVIPGRGTPELAAELVRARQEWQKLPHRQVAVPVDHVGDTAATRWTSRDGRWSATVTEGGALAGMPGYVLLADETHMRPEDRDRIRMQILHAVGRSAWRPAAKEAERARRAELLRNER